MRSLLLPLLAGGWMSCAPFAPAPGHPPLAWRLVEVAAPGGKLLVLEAYDPSGTIRCSIRFSTAEAAVGEIVEAEISLPEARALHRIEVVPDRPGVTILGAREFHVEKGKPVRARFTCSTPGRGGITVLVRE